ncbi:MAG: hypothetical protein AAGA84_04920 [Pseudomonadota bacterium]
MTSRITSVFLLFLVVGCSGSSEPEAVENAVADAPVASEADAPPADAQAHHDTGDLPLEFRLAFMSGHVNTGITLYRAGEPEAAAPHLLHPVSESYAEEREGLDEVGFDASLFETVSAALERGETADAIASELAAAEAHLDAISETVGGDQVAIIRYLMETIADEYAVGVDGTEIVNAGEYQDAYGFMIEAQQRAAMLAETEAFAVQQPLAALAGLFSDVPRDGEVVTDESIVVMAAQAVAAALAGDDD